MRWYTVLLAMIYISCMGVALAIPYRANAQASVSCNPPSSVDGSNCNHDIIPNPVQIWKWCGLVNVDIVMHSFEENSNCPMCWHSAITGNAINGWNTAFSARFGRNLFREVGGRPYQVKFHMYDSDKFTDRFDDTNMAHSLVFHDGTGSCCGGVDELSMVKIYIRASDDWHFTDSCASGRDSQFNAKWVSLHELGHAVSLLDDDRPIGFPYYGSNSLMNYHVCSVWPKQADGEAIFCAYHNFNQCSCQPQ